eukprot:CAMPEP_0178422318 /NCGR_PEP_ID=MMETSP0689_2-20121128/27109_1 /TAXON_ID=160604 /ORGANISM="Amphidinium massartii, Strain CS-259" /LENGTH=198 /DNA_ID=CAMNT_0020043873 /DNA_START=24 /DNA_END=620 /DNA_ORIENTATION=+
MLFPMPGAIPSISGPPTEYARSMWPLLLLILAVQTVVCILRLVLLLDIMGGFVMAIAIGLGWYAAKEDMNITFLCYWGMMCLFNGVFDSVQLVDFAVKLPSLVLVVNTIVFWVLVLIPVSMLSGSLLAWKLYKNHQEDYTSESSQSSGFLGSSFGLRRDLFARGGGGTGNEGRSLLGSHGLPSFATFGGKGHRLGDQV